ncbi:MAG: hypothetical protein JNM56_22645 [Planctomycetia bacterium]|nr:hypothetical protein [Planctomycetia bacterium]
MQSMTCVCGNRWQFTPTRPESRTKCGKCGRPAVDPPSRRAPTGVRTWVYPDLPWGDNLVVLTATKLASVRVDSEKLTETQSAVAKAAAVEDALGDEATVLPLDSLLEIRTHQHDEVIDVYYRDDDGKRVQQSFAFADTQKRDELLDALGRQLGWQLTTKQLAFWQAGLWPAFTLALLALFTFGFTVAAREMAAGNDVRVEGAGRKRATANLLLWVVDLVGVWGVLLVGGLAMAGAGAWLYLRVRRPPIRLTLQPR